jgi:agmatine deiminase
MLPALTNPRMPAEWEPHQATWLSWPHNLETWPEDLDRVEGALARAVRALAPRETVRINVHDTGHERHVRAVLDDAGAGGDVRFHHIPTNDAWIRDHGAIFVVSNGSLAATDWGFNSWGGKYPPWDLDDRVPQQMADVLGVPRFEADIILEGGSIEVNGRGLLLTTESCLLNPNRNPHLSRPEIEDRLRRFLGVEQILWLRDGIIGDDTDGHIDDLTRFIRHDAVVTVVEEDPGRENYIVLRENLERLQSMRTPDGRPLNIVPLPMPEPVTLRGEQMPASYANFYVANGVVLVPIFEDPRDGDALQILARCFPGRDVIPIDCRDVIWGLGALHCLTQQVPARAPDFRSTSRRNVTRRG